MVIVTTTLAKIAPEFEGVRAKLALKTIRAARKHGYRILTIDGGSPATYIRRMHTLGAMVKKERRPGMGNCRRQAIASGCTQRIRGHLPEAIAWIEPEKHTMIPFLKKAVKLIVERKVDLVMFRISLESYPPEQKFYYALGRLAFRYLTGMKFDYPFGPVIMSRRAARFFLEYKGEYGDLWDSILIPKLRIIKAGLSVVEIPIRYSNPKEQTRAEVGNMDLFVKRVRQLENLISSMKKEVSR